MLIIQWLKRLPAQDGIVVCTRTATNCDTTEEVVAEARTIWANAASSDAARPDGFQVVDQDGRSVCVACYDPDGETCATDLPAAGGARL